VRKFEVLRLEHVYENVSRQRRYVRLNNEMCGVLLGFDGPSKLF
jgi:hypothetical protein